MDFLIAMADCRIAVITIGLIGNLITFIVFSRPVFSKNSISTYCRALAIFDCFSIYELVADVGLVSFNYFVPQKSDIGCKLYYYAGMCQHCRIEISLTWYHIFYFINYSSSFLIHLATNSIFRREIFVLLKLRRSDQTGFLNPNRISFPS